MSKNKAWEKGEPPSLACTEFQIPLFRVQLNFSFTSMLLCTDSGTCGTEDQTILLPMISNWYTGFIFASTSVEFNFWQPIFWKLFLANPIGFCTEKYVSKPSVMFGSHLLATCCAYLAISCSTCLGYWDYVDFFEPKRSVLRFSMNYYSKKSSEHIFCSRLGLWIYL